jgi:hypothetical protein
MKLRKLVHSIALAVSLACPPSLFAASAQVSVDDREERQLARIRREVLRAKMEGRGDRLRQRADGVGDCGSVSIGNVSEKRTVGQRNVTVVVQGPIVNADVKCR